MILASCLISCSDDTCSDNRNALPLAGFYVGGQNEDTPVSVAGIAVVGVGLKGDSVLSEASASKEKIYLPFRIDSDETRYAFVSQTNEGEVLMADTVTFLYSRTPRFVSASCGVSYIFNIRKITAQGLLIDSVTCPAGYIDNRNEENLRIYFSDKLVKK